MGLNEASNKTWLTLAECAIEGHALLGKPAFVTFVNKRQVAAYASFTGRLVDVHVKWKEERGNIPAHWAGQFHYRDQDGEYTLEEKLTGRAENLIQFYRSVEDPGVPMTVFPVDDTYEGYNGEYMLIVLLLKGPDGWVKSRFREARIKPGTWFRKAEAHLRKGPPQYSRPYIGEEPVAEEFVIPPVQLLQHPVDGWVRPVKNPQKRIDFWKHQMSLLKDMLVNPITNAPRHHDDPGLNQAMNTPLGTQAQVAVEPGDPHAEALAEEYARELGAPVDGPDDLPF